MSTSPAPDVPFEVRDAGAGRGLGCFATRDIAPGEIILVTTTSFYWDESPNSSQKVWKIIDRYEDLDYADRKECDSLHGLYKPATVGRYRKILSEQRSDGSYCDEEEQEKFLRLLLAVDTNCFGTDMHETALFPKASRFNHSCDPNVTYETSSSTHRWTGRATRDIAKGEELLVTYLPTHAQKKERNRELLQTWGFTCDCPKCAGGPDEYTASLIRARDAAYATKSEKTKAEKTETKAEKDESEEGESEGSESEESDPPPIYGDDAEAAAERLRLRTELLKEIVELEGPAAIPRRRELAYALYDAAVFHQEYENHYKNEGGDAKSRTLKRMNNLTLEIEYLEEATKWARTAWSEEHELVCMFGMEAWRAKRKWTELLQRKGAPGTKMLVAKKSALRHEH